MKNCWKSMMSLKLLVLISLCIPPLMTHPAAPVQLTGGQAQGSVSVDGSHLQYLGIPYATVTHRFQAAEPNPTWDGVFNARNEHIRCKQRFMGSRILGEEDCLTLNVYTPKETSDSPLPVMVFIHGGGFRDGSGSPFAYGPKFLVKHGVILVTLNYRVEVLGFLCLGIKEAPGNVGMKDQVEALKWVQNNIRAFGGDPDNVTIFGESAGAASVSFHLLSPMSKGLFHRAVMQSGSALAHWALQFEPLTIASRLAEQMGYSTEDPIEIYNVFANMTAEDLLSHRVPRKKGDIYSSEIIFVPCIEKKIHNVERFLTDSPYNLITKGKYNKVPVIIGFNNEEGYYFTGRENETTLANANFYDALPRDLMFPTDEEKMKTAKMFDQLYMNGEKITEKKDSLRKFSRFEGDAIVIYPVVATMELFLRTLNKPVFAYKFQYDGFLNYAKMAFGFRGSPGATHGDELFYLFSSLALPPNLELKFINKFTEMWTNFAKYSNPTPPSSSILPQWESAALPEPKLMVIDEDMSMAPIWKDNTHALQLWNTTYAKYRKTMPEKHVLLSIKKTLQLTIGKS
ncbi:cholinesterase 2-like [Helicoverpa zea]|uniref:cholinesterase 2-like n=1 Tax=Helicoverpa zea TaxID=7113 RepID=UPI001F59A85D|nr:cholinesterase 2-like [Helicoverpa zea]